MIFNEDSRVKIPTVLHLMRLGYKYLVKKEHKRDHSTNIFTDIFENNIKRLNPDLTSTDIKRYYDNISLCLDNKDIGKSFYEKITAKSGIRAIDFENFDNNEFHVLTELTYKNDDDEFRPDITLLVNGMPLVFLEVKKPNNKDGVLAERERIQSRFKNKKFRKFINITQLIIFSNNMEYEDTSHLPIEGAFYATSSYENSEFNYFREEEELNLSDLLNEVSEEEENLVLRDNNLFEIKKSEEFEVNKNIKKPTNKICTSLFLKNRLAFFLKYGFAYLVDKGSIQKHVIRYQQFFALKNIKKNLDKNQKKGVIWHTQGSGKTALTFFSVNYLINYFQDLKKIPKFYFIVDRLDLLKQANSEFSIRGLEVNNVNSKEEFLKNIKSKKSIHNDVGKNEITVVNIQKFQDEGDITNNNDYNLDIQRIYFLDEVHRSYNPKGSFLANLENSDPNAIKFGLTGTPLIGKEYNTKSLFGDYVHKYYYNQSIADGYTLRLIREEIDSEYKITLNKIIKDINLQKGQVSREQLYAHPRFVEPMLDYIINDFENSRLNMNNNTIGGMVICDSSLQAKKMYEMFNEKYKTEAQGAPIHKIKKTQLILHDVADKDEIELLIKAFKKGEIDLLFVYRMLQTGFDCKRLKKLYLGRLIKSHTLLQALTRVNRPYKEFRYGYVVDFADIQKEFDETNQAYFNELQLVLGDEFKNNSNLFKSEEEIKKEITEIKELLFEYDTKNIENFSSQMSSINDKSTIIKIVKTLKNTRELYNKIRLSRNYSLLKEIDFSIFNKLYRESVNRLNLINTKENLENSVHINNILNIALEDVIFSFNKIGEQELVLADQYRDLLQKTRETLGNNYDPEDVNFINIKDELERLFRKKNLKNVTRIELEKNIPNLGKIYKNSKELNRKNTLLKSKYQEDEKYARLHKRIKERNILETNDQKIFEVINNLKKDIDDNVLKNINILSNEGFVDKMFSRIIYDNFTNKHQLNLSSNQIDEINLLVKKEYILNKNLNI